MAGARRYFRVNSPPVVLETVEEETIAVNLDTGLYYDLNHSASHVLRLLDGGADVDETADWLIARYMIEPDASESVRGATKRLVDELVADGLVAAVESPPSDAGTPGQAAPEPAARPWAEPALGRHEDMQELLLLDPVHDVDGGGWPNRP